MNNTCSTNGHYYTNKSDVIRRCTGCGKRQYKSNGIWKDEPKQEKIKAPAKTDPQQMALFN